ncbi:hypothetical protein EDB80DRAFT_806752 [Ilyonectria destructans]|nr:hypothetical protein EDB80DRAFT_806752 [Ilyonectria destructans]
MGWMGWRRGGRWAVGGRMSPSQLVWPPGSRLSGAGLVRTSGAQTTLAARQGACGLWAYFVQWKQMWKRKRGYFLQPAERSAGVLSKLAGGSDGVSQSQWLLMAALAAIISRKVARMPQEPPVKHALAFLLLHLVDAVVPRARSSYCARPLVPPYVVSFPTRRSRRGVLTAEAHLVSAPRPNPTLVGCPSPPSSHSDAVYLRLARLVSTSQGVLMPCRITVQSLLYVPPICGSAHAGLLDIEAGSARLMLRHLKSPPNFLKLCEPSQVRGAPQGVAPSALSGLMSRHPFVKCRCWPFTAIQHPASRIQNPALLAWGSDSVIVSHKPGSTKLSLCRFSSHGPDGESLGSLSLSTSACAAETGVEPSLSTVTLSAVRCPPGGAQPSSD